MAIDVKELAEPLALPGNASKPSLLIRLAKIAVPLGLLGYFLWAFVDFAAFMVLVEKVDAPIVLAYFGSLLLARWVQALQTRLALLATGLKLRSLDVFRAQLIATYYTMFVPGDLVGGGVTWYLLKQRCGGGAMVATVLVYLRLLFLAAAIPFVVFGLMLESRLHSPALFVGLSLLAMATLLAIAPLVFRSAATLAGTFIAFLASRFLTSFERARRGLTMIRECLTTSAAASSTATLAVFAMALVLHVLGALGMWLSAEAAHALVPLHAFLWIWPLMILVHMLPISFGGLGVREITLIYLLKELYGTSAESVLMLSMIALAATIVISLAGGIWNFFGAHGESPR